jgi:hypothetical protein
MKENMTIPTRKTIMSAMIALFLFGTVQLKAQVCALTAGVVKVNPTCYGDCDGSVTVNPAHGSGQYAYLWSTGASTQSITSLCAGTYTATVTDLVTQCTIVKTAIIKKGRVTGKFTLVNATCGQCNGSITAQGQGGNGAPFTYLWSTGETTAAITGICAGVNYTITITDKLGCTFVCHKSVRNVGTPFTLTPGIENNTSCTNDCNGSITVTPSVGAVADYTYLWSNGATTNVIEDLCAGDYTVTVTNGSGCAQTATYNVGDDADCECDGDFTTYTQGGWANNGAPGQYMAAHFDNCFGSVVVGDACGYTITLTSVQAVQDFLPQGSTPAALTQNYIDPGSGNITVLAGQVLGVQFALGFDDCDPDLSGSNSDLGDQLYIKQGSVFYGWSIQAIYDTARKVLSGCPSLYTPEEVNEACTDINENYDEGNNNGLFICPDDFVTRMSSRDTKLVNAYPNPFESEFFLEINTDEALTVTVTDITGRTIDQYVNVMSSFNIKNNWKNGIYFITLENESRTYHNSIKILRTE